MEGNGSQEFIQEITSFLDVLKCGLFFFPEWNYNESDSFENILT
jgi:hypothetical protein